MGIVWKLSQRAQKNISELPQEIRRHNDSIKVSIRRMVQGYIEAVPGCRESVKTHSISPMGAGPNGGKLLKLEVGIPGRGSSRSLRVFVEMFCEQETVVLLSADWKKNQEDAQ